MLITSAEAISWVGSFLWPFFRIAALIGSMPVTGTQLVPVRIRTLLAVAITVVVFPLLPDMPAVEIFSGEGFLITAQQILIGVSMGLAMQFVFGSLMVGGQMIAMSMGLGFANMTDPINGVTVPTVGQFYVMFATLLFLALNGHLVLFQVIAKSFELIPVGVEGITSGGIWYFVNWAGVMFVGAVLLALPTVAAVMLVNLSFGVMMKAAPQFNIFTVLFPVAIIFGFMMIILTLPNAVPTFTDLVESAFNLYRELGVMSY